MYHPTTSKISFIVDPQRDGIGNALWFVVTGTPAVSSSRFRFNTAEGLVRSDLKYGRFEFSLVLPTTGVQRPTNLNGDVEFGLKNLSLGTLGKIAIVISKSGNSITLKSYDDYGTLTSTVLTWRDAWNSAQTIFIFEWFNDRVRLSVREASGTTASVEAEHTTGIPNRPLNMYVKASDNDNIDVDFIAVREANVNSTMLI
jgi:hypothetical protein